MQLPRLNNLTDLANLLRNIDNSPESDLGFDMSHDHNGRFETEHPCGSACCIGGWIQACNDELRDCNLEDAVQKLQPDLDLEECYNLCFPYFEREKAWNATPKQAARAVEILRDTGKCEWEKIMKRARKWRTSRSE